MKRKAPLAQARKKGEDVAQGPALPKPPPKRTKKAARSTPAEEIPLQPSFSAAYFESRLRRDGYDYERINPYVPVEMARELRLHCTRERRSLSDAVTEALKLLFAQYSASSSKPRTKKAP